MELLKSVADTLMVLVVGLAVRLGIFVAVILAIAVPVLLVVLAVAAIGRVARRAGGEEIYGLEWKKHAIYTPAHMWLRQGVAGMRLGIDALAARLLRGSTIVEMVKPGASLHKGDTLVTFAAADQLVSLGAPVDGTVSRVNSKLLEYPALAVANPYGGWLVEMTAVDPRLERAGGDGSRDWFAQEAARFTHALEHAAGVAAADGGEPLDPDRLPITRDEFAALAREFLNGRVTTTPSHAATH